ncbi:MAG: lipase maturation factor family protein, partial [Acidobacteriota bacterium]
QWEWFRIYFESGLVKLMSGDPQWRNFTAMAKYYENGPLPTWIAWYADKLPLTVHMITTAIVLLVELFVVWLMFVPSWARRAAHARSIFGGEAIAGQRHESVIRGVRMAVFAMTAFLQLGIILTANYAFLNFIVIALGIAFLDDRTFTRLGLNLPLVEAPAARHWWSALTPAFLLSWVFYATVAGFMMIGAGGSVLTAPAVALAPFRIANNYGLFAVMTRNRYEIEFQGSHDGKVWTAYPFRFKPQGVDDAPGIYAPYQPRFEWNLWFASLGRWEQDRWVVNVEMRLAEQSPPVLRLFRGDPFANGRPRFVRAVLWQYWFSDWKTKNDTGAWWRRKQLGLYAPVVERLSNGRIVVVE